ncbi:MAG: monoamine oxidase [Actinomycetota bacterium]|nr:monoamine oxidase [Actinomycetota bacterium]
MPRTPLAGLVSAAWQQADREMQGGSAAAVDTSRRDFLRRSGTVAVAAVGATALGDWRPAANAATAPRVAVVGAGLAGLSAAYQLKKAGYSAQVYEASTRLGGRCWSYNSGEFDAGQVSEHGGELIDQNHTQIRQLAQELGLTLDNLLAAEPNGSESTNYFFGKPYTYTQATNDLKGIWQQIHSDVSAASYPTLYNSYTQRGWDLDHMSIASWIDSYVPGGHGSPLGQLLDVAYNIEYGAECSAQSSLNMLYLLGYSGQGQMRIFGPSNEKSHVKGGNDLIVDGLVAALPGQIATGVALTALARNNDGTYKLTWSTGKSTTADRVVLALPFTLLRQVDWSKAGFNTVKQLAIKSSAMGTNSKLHLQFDRRSWYDQGCNGETYADTGYQNTWEVSRAQAGTQGILVNYTGGTIGSSFAAKNGTPAQRAQKFLGQIEPVLPGITQRWNGRAYIDYWAGNPWTLGSYSYWKVGAYTSFVGAEREVSGACHFAGEHTSIDFQGYLNGAVESGYRAANEIVAAYKKP